MKHKAIKFFAICLLSLLPLVGFSQEQKTPEQQEKEFKENIDKQVDELANSLDLEDWQIFYADSILVHDYTAMKDEFEEMGRVKVSNADLYIIVQDKWAEKVYNAMRKILNDEQWAKYNKQGAGKEKKARDKRAAKRNI